MSKLLSALAQSDAQRTPVPPPSGTAYRKGGEAKPASPWLLAGAGFALPVLGMVGYLLFQQYQAGGSMAPGQATSEPEVAFAQASQPEQSAARAAVGVPERIVVAEEYPSGIVRMAYPELYTESLPSESGQLYHARYQPSSQAAKSDSRAGNEPNGWESGPAPAASSADDSWDLDALDYSELSPQLASQLRSAIAATGDGESLPQLLREERLPPMPEPQEPMSAVSIGDLPASVQDRIPSLNFQTHIYSSAANSRWVKVNGSEAYEGDEIAPGVTLRRIEPRNVIFDFESYLISMPALSEW